MDHCVDKYRESHQYEESAHNKECSASFHEAESTIFPWDVQSFTFDEILSVRYNMATF